MIPLLTCGFLLTLLFVAHFWGGKRFAGLQDTFPLAEERPEFLPAPWAGHTSSIFSLTALFGAYLGVIILVGFIAGFGLAFGSTMALLLLRFRISRILHENPEAQFEHTLQRLKFAKNEPLDLGLWVLVLACLIGFAASEVVILREVALLGFSMSPHHATVFVLLIALFGYYYCLLGGYAAVYRTDFVQFFAVIAMCIGLGLYASWLTWRGDSAILPVPSSGATSLSLDYWPLPSWMPDSIEWCYQFIVGAIMGLGFLLASPDTWKRVFIIVSHQSEVHHRFKALIFAGFLPFIFLTPLLLALPDDFIQLINGDFIIVIPGKPILLAFGTVGLLASFLSSFDSMLVTATHIVLVRPNGRFLGYPNSLPTYRLLLVSILLTVLLGGLALISWIQNPYFLANLLLGPFAAAAALVLGTSGFQRQITIGITGWLTLLMLAAWSLYFMNLPGVFYAPHPDQIQTVPLGALIFLVLAILTRITSRRR